jgi:hypothetical protein
MLTATKAWSIIEAALIEGGVVVAVVGIYWIALYLVSLMLPSDSVVVWWLGNIHLVLAIILPTVLALVFLNSLLRIALDAIISVWKGFLHVSPNVILA